MSGIPTQFGIEESQLWDAADIFSSSKWMKCAGVQVYLGTRVLNHQIIIEAVGRILALARKVEKDMSTEFEMIDLGGGFGIPLFEGESELDTRALLSGLSELLNQFVLDRPGVRLAFEIGRFIVGPAGVFVTTVLYEKVNHGKKFVICDGGANAHCSATGYANPNRRNWPIRKVHGAGQKKPVTISGPLCTPIDTLAVDMNLPPLSPGDLVRIDQSGAYGPTHSPVYFISHGFPAELAIEGERIILIRPADRPEDMIERYTSIPLDTG